MKKSFISTLLLALVLASCGTPSSSTPPSSESNNVPLFSGVKDEDTIHLGATWNALEGVSVTDIEDGDLSDDIVISSIPALVNNEGILYPDAQGEYYITYSVTDGDDNLVEAYTTLYVEAPLPVETLYQELDLSQSSSLSLHEWNLVVKEGVIATLDQDNEVLTLTIDEAGTLTEDILFSKESFAFTTGSSYHFEVTLRGSGQVILGFMDISNETPLLLAASEAQVIQETLTTLEFDYLATTDTAYVSLNLLLGGIENNDTSLEIHNIRLTSQNSESESVNVILDDFSSDIQGWNYGAYDGASASLSHANEQLNFTINNYASFNKPWNINLYRQTDINLEAGALYRVSMDITTLYDQFYELCIEDYRLDWQVRAGFKNGTLSTTTTSIEMIFTASMDITGTYFKLALGQGSNSANTLTIDNFSVEVLSDQIINDDFIRHYSEPTWDVYNVEGGEGSASGISGDLVYQITQLGTQDWHNKIGFENVTLAANSMYRFSFKIKADKLAKAQFIINESGTWNPLINQVIDIDIESQTFSFTTDSVLYYEMNVELLFQLGGFSENTAPLTITLEALSIYQIK